MFNEELWNRWVLEELKNYRKTTNPKTGKLGNTYLKKGYLHFDSRYWFPSEISELKKFISAASNIAVRPFYPFIKVIHKTPRFRFDPGLKKRVLERKARPICYASHFDALIYGYYSYYLTEVYESYIGKYGQDKVVLAYRTDLNKCNIDFSKEIFDYIKREGDCTALALDVKGFFDHLDHNILHEKWVKVLENDDGRLPNDQQKIFKSLTSYSYVNRNTLLANLKVNLASLNYKPKSLLALIPGKRDYEKFNYLRQRNIIATNYNAYGIPQGSPMSAVLSNIYMIDYDKEMLSIAKKYGCLYQRYCDDILFVCKTTDAPTIKEKAYNEIKKYKLCIQEKKEEEILFKNNSKGQFRSFNAKKLRDSTFPITSTNEQQFYKPLQYLGFEYNGANIVIRSSSTSRYMRRMRARASKTIKMAYSDSGKGTTILKKKLLHKYTHLGKRNFITYALRSSKRTYAVSDGSLKFGMNSPAIRKQISKHYSILTDDLVRKNRARIFYKYYAGKLKRIKKI